MKIDRSQLAPQVSAVYKTPSSLTAKLCTSFAVGHSPAPLASHKNAREGTLLINAPRVCSVCGMESIAPMLRDISDQLSVVANLLQLNLAAYCCDVGHLFIVSIGRRVGGPPACSMKAN